MTPRVGVIGAGLSGLLAARTLQDSGWEVTVFDKGRRPGGRANTREHGNYRFDHGAQYFTVRDPGIERLLGEWMARGVVAEWSGTLVRLDGEAVDPATPAARFVGVPGMVDLALHLAEGLQVHTGIRVEGVHRNGSGWRVSSAEGEDVGRFDWVIVAVPAAQAVPLLAGAPTLQTRAAGLRMAPCWATMLAFEHPLELGFDGAFVTDGPFSWLARDSSKPGRQRSETWVVHATPAWTDHHWTEDREEIPTLMANALADRFGPLPAVTFQRAHRWGYALPRDSATGQPLWDLERGMVACGDWCLGGRVEGALLSGLRTAEELLAAATQPMGPRAHI